MNESKNLLLKLFVLLTVAVGGVSSAWAQGFPVEGQVYTIKARFANDQYDSYLTNGGTNLTFVHSESETTVGSYWVAERSGATNFQWRFRNVADESKFLNASSGLGDATNTNSHFNVRNCTNVGGGLYHLEGMITNRNIATWGFGVTTKNGFGGYGSGGCWAGGGHNNGGNPAWSTDYEIAPVTNYKLIINGDDNYTVTYDGTGYSNGATMPSFDEANLKDLKGFSINCSGKFVYGPVIRKDRKTVTYTISNPETSLTEGWYQMQVMTNNGVNGKIAARSTNINTQSASIYAMAMVDEHIDSGNNYWGMKYSGVPTYAGEAATYVYITPNGSSNTQFLLPTGHYMQNNGCTSRTAVNVTTRWQNNLLATNQWVESNATGWDEAPAAAASSGYPRNMALHKIDLSQYSVYKVMLDGWVAAANTYQDPTVTIVSTSTAAGKNRGLSKVYQNGYFFFERGYEPTLEDFDVSGVDFTEMTMDIEGTGDVKTLHFKEFSEPWYKIKNHRKANGYLSVADAGLEADQRMKWGVTAGNTAAEYWQLKADGNNGYRIINKAYGEDYVLGIENTDNKAYVRMYHISEANTTNTHFDKVPSNTSGEFCIMLHSNHGIAIHDIDNRLGTWSNGSENTHKSDPGSAFIFTKVGDDIINAIPDYTAYRIEIEGNTGNVTYDNPAQVIGQNPVAHSRYMVLADAAPLDKSHFTVSSIQGIINVEKIENAGQPKKLRFTEAQIRMGDRVTVRIVDQHTATVEGASVYFVKPDKSRMELTEAGNPYNLSAYDFHANSFVGSDDYLLLHVDYNTDTQVLTFTVTEFTPEWYIINHGYNHSNKYLSSDYVTNNGNLNYQSVKPNNYAGIWMIQNLTGGGLNFANAKYYATKVLTVVNSNNARMDDINAIRPNAEYEVNKVEYGNKWRFPMVANTSRYLGMSSFQVEVRAATNDGSIDMTLERVPNLGKRVTIRVTDAEDNVLPQGNVVYRSQREDIPTVMALLTNDDIYNFSNVPYLRSLFEDSPTCHLLEVAYDEEQALLTFKVNQMPVKEWTIRITDGADRTPNTANTVAYKSVVTAKNGVRMSLPLTVLHEDFTIDASDDKFVWGPVIDEKAATVTYSVRNRATTITDGWYQMQLVDDLYTLAINQDIKPEVGNINTRSQIIYALPALYDAQTVKMKFSGIPQYGGEATTFVRFTDVTASRLTVVTASGATVGTYNYQFADGVLKLQGWGLEQSAQPLEGPLFSVSGSDYNLGFNLYSPETSQYNIYQLNFTGDTSSISSVKYTGSNNLGAGNIVNHGYLILPAGSSVPLARQFAVGTGNGTINAAAYAVGEKNASTGITPITIGLTGAKDFWKVNITGFQYTRYHVLYNNETYNNGDVIALDPGTVISPDAIKTDCTDQFVWGPIFRKATNNDELNTVNFEIRSTTSEISTEGQWYQLMMRDKEGQVFTSSAVQHDKPSMVDAVNALSSMRQRSSNIYPIAAGTNSWPIELTGTTGADMEPSTFIYMQKKADGVTMMMQNGQYVASDGQGSTNANSVVSLNYQEYEKTFKWISKVLPWDGLANGKLGVGYTSSADEGLMEFFVTPVETKVYKVAGLNGNEVSYTGLATIIGGNVVRDGFLFLQEGDVLETIDDTHLDKTKFNSEYTINSITLSKDGIFDLLTFDTEAPNYDHVIIHRQARYYDMLETETNKPPYGFIKEGEGWNVREGKDGKIIREQNTAVFEIPVYLIPGGDAFTSYLPSNQLGNYQRWYNWDTDGDVDTSVLTRSLSSYTHYNNGYAYFRNNTQNNGDAPTLKLPADMTEYNVGLDISRLTDYETNRPNNCALEPTLGMRIIYQVRDAKIMANKIKQATKDETFSEVHNITFPSVKHGTLSDKTIGNLLPLDFDMNNYWIFDGQGTGDGNLVQLKETYGEDETSMELIVELAEGSVPLLNYRVIDNNENAQTGNIKYDTFNTGHFILFQYPEGGRVENGGKATINVYLKSSTSDQRQNLAQFNLTFIDSAEPVVVTELPGSHRHPDALRAEYGAPVAQLTFDGKHNNEYGDWYRYPIDYKGASYAFGAMNNSRTWFASRGEYGLTNLSGTSGGHNYKFYPVRNYFNAMADANTVLLPKEPDAYHLYIDAADQPGKVASIALEDHLCAGSRLFCYGYISCTSGGSDQNPTSILINVMGIDKETGKEVLVYSYCPGIITLRGYDAEGHTVYAAAMGRGTTYEAHEGDTNYWAPWQQVGFSFTIDAVTASQMKGYSVQIVNNAWNSLGADTVLDDFEIFVSPPKGVVDFTTPLCSDQVRHAKIHADFNTLKELTDIKETKIHVSYCFLDAEIFDNYTENGVAIKDVFEVDAQGNHNLNVKLTDDMKALINKAFGAALVGSRRDNLMEPYREDHGFHYFDIPLDYTDLPVYAYNDSENEVVYREEVNGIQRIVFKEDVKRGEMYREKDTDGHWYWPYLRPSREYYLVFAPLEVNEKVLENHNVATEVFMMHETCSFLGKFTTKDPMHVILDNAEIESDLPVRAVCYGETVNFEFDMPALKFDADMPKYPITDQAFCISDESMDGEVVPSSQGLNHYRYEHMFNEDKDMLGKIKNMPYDWWIGGRLDPNDDTTEFGGMLDDYLNATHPTIKYAGPADIAHKKDDAPVSLAQAMTDFRFYYPDFGMGKTDIDGNTTLTAADFDALAVQDYNADTGYGLLRSEINTIKDFVLNGLLILHRTSYNMPMTGKKAKQLTPDELNKMTREELNSQILNLALKLHEGATFDHDKPLKDMEGKVLDLLTAEGRKTLTFQEFAGESFEQVKVMAKELLSENKLTGYTEEQIDNAPESELRRDVEAVLRAMAEADLRTFAMKNFTDIGPVKRAHLLLRALNIMNEETLASMTPEQLKDEEKIREVLRGKMISIFNVLQADVLRKMWSDISEKLKADEITALLRKEGNPATIQNPEKMEAAELSVLVEKALGVITNNIITDLNSDKYIHFTLVPIMPSQKNFVDEPYIICPEPRGVKMRITSKAPRMFDGFADMPYPDKMDNVPVRIGLQQIDAVPYSDANDAKTLRIPLRRLSRAQEDGTLDQFEVNERGYGRYLFLVETNDPAYKREGATAAADGLTKAALLPVDDPKKDYPADEDDEFGRHHLIGMVSDLQASYDKEDNYMNILFNPDFKFREGYTYRVGFNFVESTRKTDAETGEVVYERNQSCFGTMLFDIKIVPEYQKWTGAVSNDWTNDANWQRADRTDLHADNLPTGEVITGSTAFAKTSANDKEAAERYPTNADNKTAESFIPMAFTNTLIAEGASHMPALYRVDVPERSKKETVGEKEVTIPGHFLGEPKPKVEGVPNDDKTPAAPLKPTASVDAKYDMEVYDATGAWHTADNYECGLFGTYVAKGITFEPATSLYNAQLLTYQKAWVEYALNTKRWYTLASPLQETYSGEWYSPTGSGDTKGKQLTPHFYGITYKTELNDRFNPAYYQHSWDKATANVYQCLNEGAVFGENPHNAFVALTWSKVYNDVQVDYTNGGFSVKTLLADEDESPEHASEYHEVLVRMPKEDAAFDYYDPANVHPGHNTPIARTAAHHRLNSDLLNTKTGLVQKLKNDNESEYYLVANPFIAPMDMDEFFNENKQFESGKYWILSNDKQEANIKVEDEGGKWISTDGTASGDVAPLQAFFVKRTATTKDAISVVYTAAMQVAPGNTPLPLKMRSVDNDDAPAAFTISNGESDALCYFSENASADYREGEDAELLLDSNLSDHVATVFTAASGQALHVNVLPLNVTTIPVGVIAPEDDTESILTFTGVAHLEAVMPEQPHLYDAANGAFKPVEEGTEIAIEGTSSGRYYLVSGKHLPYTDIIGIEAETDEDVDLYNLHGIRVASPQKGNITIRGTRKEFHKR